VSAFTPVAAGLLLYAGWAVLCTHQADTDCRKTVKSGSSKVNFVPTHHWLPDESALNGISSFCYIDTIKQSSAETLGADKYSCFPWSKDRVNEYQEAMTLCFAEAMRQGLTVYVRYAAQSLAELSQRCLCWGPCLCWHRQWHVHCCAPAVLQGALNTMKVS